MRIAASDACFSMPEATGTSPERSWASATSDCSYPGRIPSSSGTTHIWMNRTGVAPGLEDVVLLRVEDPGAGAHPLRQPRVDDAVVPLRVLVDQRPLEDPRHDLHVAVGMRLEAGAGGDDVVV